MKDETGENLKDLFEKFLDPAQAEQAAQDVRKGEQILRAHTAPEPDDKLIADIKAEISSNLLQQKKIAFRKAVYKTAVVAAAFIFLAVISVKLFEQDRGEPKMLASNLTIPSAVWESDRLADDNADMANLIAEIEEIESDLFYMQLGENGSNGQDAVTELETELIEINNDFWKG